MNGRRAIKIDGTSVKIDYPAGGVEHEAKINVAQRLGPPEDRPPAFTVLALDALSAHETIKSLLRSIVVTRRLHFHLQRTGRRTPLLFKPRRDRHFHA